MNCLDIISFSVPKGPMKIPITLSLRKKLILPYTVLCLNMKKSLSHKEIDRRLLEYWKHT